MLTHDQNQNPTDLKDEIQQEGEGELSKPTEIDTAPETETTAAEANATDETQDEVQPDEQPEPSAEEPAIEPVNEEPAEPEASEPTSEPVVDEPIVEPEASEPAPEPIVEVAVAEPAQEEPEVEPVVEEITEPAPEETPVAEEPVVAAPKRKSAPPKVEPIAPEHQEMMDLIEEHASSFRRGQIIEGTVVSVTDKEIVVDIGFKSDGVISLSEFEYTGIPELNSSIMVFINELDNGEGRLSLSKRKADFIKNIELIKQAHADGEVLTGVIKRRVKGGMIVSVMGIEAFLPGSQMSLKPIPNLDQFIGKEMSFKVVNIDEEHKNIILSRKMVLEAEAAEKRQELLEKLNVETELDGEVKNITQYGAFIDLGGIDGLLHLTDMSWGKINHPSEMLSIGDKVKVKVIKFDPETNKISLGLKQLVPHPWETIELKFPEGVRITGKVVSVKSFGAFVEIEPGVEGLVHISEMSWTKKITDARKIVKIGDVVNAIVLELDKENRRISLGMKQMDANPWLSIEDHYPIGTVLTRPIKSLTAFGAFVEIEDGIDGLIHISDISWTKRIYHPREIYRKGQEVEAVILSIDRALHRIALGVKQLSPDPWENLNIMLPINTEVKGKISKLIPKGVLVDVQAGENVVEGFIPISHLGIPKLEHSEEAFHASEEIPLKVIELDMENRRLILSVKAFFFSRDPKLQEEYIALHEQYMRERIARLQKKKTERSIREKQREDKPEGEEHVAAEHEPHDEEAPHDEVEASVVEPVSLEEAPAVEQDQPEPVVQAEEITEEPIVEAAPETEPEPEPTPVTEPLEEAATPVIEEAVEEPIAEAVEAVEEPVAETVEVAEEPIEEVVEPVGILVEEAPETVEDLTEADAEEPGEKTE